MCTRIIGMYYIRVCASMCRMCVFVAGILWHKFVFVQETICDMYVDDISNGYTIFGGKFFACLVIFGIPRNSGPQNFMIMHTVQSIRVLYVLVYCMIMYGMCICNN